MEPSTPSVQVKSVLAEEAWGSLRSDRSRYALRQIFWDDLPFACCLSNNTHLSLFESLRKRCTASDIAGRPPVDDKVVYSTGLLYLIAQSKGAIHEDYDQAPICNRDRREIAAVRRERELSLSVRKYWSNVMLLCYLFARRELGKEKEIEVTNTRVGN